MVRLDRSCRKMEPRIARRRHTMTTDVTIKMISMRCEASSALGLAVDTGSWMPTGMPTSLARAVTRAVTVVVVVGRGVVAGVVRFAALGGGLSKQHAGGQG